MRNVSLLPLLPLLALTACTGSTSEGLDREEAVERVLDELVDDSHPLIMFATEAPLPAGTRVSAPSSDPAADDNPEPIVLDESSWLVWIDDEPLALFSHPSRIAIVAEDDGALAVMDAKWWPAVDDERVFTDATYTDPAAWVYSHGIALDGFRDALLDDAAPVLDCDGVVRGKAIVIDAWQKGETAREDFAANGTQMKMLFESVGLETTHLGPEGTEGTDGTASALTIAPYFMQLEKDLKPGDDLVIYLTGHGHITSRSSGSSIGAYSEANLQHWLSRIDPGVNVVVILDGCHAGTMVDSLSCSADLVLTATDDRVSYGDLDSPDSRPGAWLIDNLTTNTRDVNNEDVGTEWTSSFVAGWNEVVGDPAKLESVEGSVARTGVSFVERLCAEAFLEAHDYDAAYQFEKTRPTSTRGLAKTRPAGVTYHTEGLSCAPMDPTDPPACSPPGGAADSVGSMFGLAPSDPVVTDLLCAHGMELPTGNDVLHSDGETTSTAAGAVDFASFGGARSIALPSLAELPCGPSTDAPVLCGAATPPPGGEFLVTWFAVDAPLQLESNPMYTQLAFVFDADGDPANNYVPPAEWPGDSWAGADLAVEIAHTPSYGWELSVYDMADGFTFVDVGARVVMQGRTVALAMPMDAFSVADPGARITAFEHTGDWGVGGPWSGDAYPVPGDPLFQFPRY